MPRQQQVQIEVVRERGTSLSRVPFHAVEGDEHAGADQQVEPHRDVPHDWTESTDFRHEEEDA
jgi:hypothetical protein